MTVIIHNWQLRRRHVVDWKTKRKLDSLESLYMVLLSESDYLLHLTGFHDAIWYELYEIL